MKSSCTGSSYVVLTKWREGTRNLSPSTTEIGAYEEAPQETGEKGQSRQSPQDDTDDASDRILNPIDAHLSSNKECYPDYSREEHDETKHFDERVKTIRIFQGPLMQLILKSMKIACVFPEDNSCENLSYAKDKINRHRKASYVA